MKKQKHTSGLKSLDDGLKGKKGKKMNAEKSDSYDYDYEFDSYDADEWEDSFESFKYQ